MKITSQLKIYISFFLFLTLTSALQAETDQPHASADAAEKWLKLIDHEKYKESWDYGSLTLQLTVPKNHWEMLMTQTRKPLGRVTTRKVLDLRPAKDPKGLPKGDYIVIYYETSFSNKDIAHELVTLVQESDGQWRVLTYHIQ